MRIVVTGASGFLGRNLCVRLAEAGWTDVHGITSGTPSAERREHLTAADFVYHLGGVNRAADEGEFATGNADATRELCRVLREAGRPIPVAFSSTTHVERNTAYGRSKLRAEEAIAEYGIQSGAPVYLFRLTNIFGKWSRPNYNSAIATFCHNLTRGLPITVSDPAARLSLVYVDDVVSALIDLLPRKDHAVGPAGQRTVTPVYETTVGAVAEVLRSIAQGRRAITVPDTGSGLVRALYSTYISFLPVDDFKYPVTRHVDPRGAFVEFIRTPDAGQISYFTAGPGVTRGGHYHHSKTEKFLVVQGTARFGFRDLATGARHELITTGAQAEIVDTAPGWVHDITNIGEEELIVLLWANERFNPSSPDTIQAKVSE